jgi:hypothetical protein
MSVVMILFTGILFLIIAIAVLALIRNYRVFVFRNRVNRLCHKYSNKHIGDNAYLWAYDVMPDYDEMFRSLKPLRLETFFDDETIKKLTLD